MAGKEDSLVMRRSKRSKAGNLMVAALAQYRAEDVDMDLEEDVDFVVQNDEEDAFESDFESTDEEEAQKNIDVSGYLEEWKALDDGRHTRKANRSQLDKVTAAAHKSQKATFNPQLHDKQAELSGFKMKRRVTMGSAINMETGEVAEGGKRQSQRTHTMQNTSETATRLKDAEEKKSALPKKTKRALQLPTQRELIERALKMEEGNMKEHREYLSTEEEKRRKARLVRTAVQGSLIRWVSKAEEVAVQVNSPPLQAPPSYTYTAAPCHYYPPPLQATSTSVAKAVPSRTFLHVSAAYHADLQHSAASLAPESQPQPEVAEPQTQHPTLVASQALSIVPSWHPEIPPSVSHSPPKRTTSTAYSQPTPFTALPYYHYQQYPQPPVAPGLAEPTGRKEIVGKTYLVHELSQQEKQRPPWYLTMKAMFGDHVKWEELRVYTSKGRPLSRPVQHCPITGKIANYRDPRTNVPFADVAAYETLTKVLEHEYVWCDNLGYYIG